MVGGEQQGGLLLRAGQRGGRVQELRRLLERPPPRPEDPPAPVQGPPGPAQLPVHHRRVRADRRPPPRQAPPDRGGPHPRVHPQARPPGRGRDRPDPVGHPVLPAGPLARELRRSSCPTRNPRRAPATGSSASIWASSPWPCSPPARSCPTRATSMRVLGVLRRAQRRVSRRRGPDRRTRAEPSHRWRKAKAKVAALHTRVADAAPGRAAPAHHPAGARARHDRGRGPARGRDAAQQAAGPPHRRARDGRVPPPARPTRPPRRACSCTSPTGGIPSPARPARRVVR